jgi:hypothetical protein
MPVTWTIARLSNPIHFRPRRPFRPIRGYAASRVVGVGPNALKELFMYSAALIEMLAESRLAEVAAAADRHGTAHKPAGIVSFSVPLAGNETRYPIAAVMSHALSIVREFGRAVRSNRSTAVETH